MMAIDRIISLMPPPKFPAEVNRIDWNKIELRIKKDLPDDYKNFIVTYGTGSIGGFLWIINPFSVNKNINREKISYLKESYKTMKNLFPNLYNRDLCSFLPWAVTDNGDSLVWILSEEDPNEWRVAIHGRDQGEEEITDLKTAQFLEYLLYNKLESKILPKKFLETCKVFYSNIIKYGIFRG